MNTNTFVARLFYFVEDGVEEIDNPALPQVIQAIKLLNGVSIDTVSISLINGDSMDIGGGKDNQYKCHARTKGSFFDLVDAKCDTNSRDTVSIMMNEEVNKFPRCCIVTLEMAISAASYFSTTGELNPSQSWDSSLDYEPL